MGRVSWGGRQQNITSGVGGGGSAFSPSATEEQQHRRSVRLAALLPPSLPRGGPLLQRGRTIRRTARRVGDRIRELLPAQSASAPVTAVATVGRSVLRLRGKLHRAQQQQHP